MNPSLQLSYENRVTGFNKRRSSDIASNPNCISKDIERIFISLFNKRGVE